MVSFSTAFFNWEISLSLFSSAALRSFAALSFCADSLRSNSFFAFATSLFTSLSVASWCAAIVSFLVFSLFLAFFRSVLNCLMTAEESSVLFGAHLLLAGTFCELLADNDLVAHGV